MAHKICKHGSQVKLKGGGIYFLCQFDWDRKGSHCRYAYWDMNDRLYYNSRDKGGNLCPYFKAYKPEVQSKEILPSEKPANFDLPIEDEDEIVVEALISVFSDQL